MVVRTAASMATRTCWRCAMLLLLLIIYATVAALQTAAPAGVAEPELTIGLCTVHHPVAFSFECQLAAFGGYLHHKRQRQHHRGERVHTSLALPVRLAHDGAMLACSSSSSTNNNASLSIDNPSRSDVAVLVHRGACSFQDKLLHLVTVTHARERVRVMVLINTDDTLLQMGTLDAAADTAALQDAAAVSVKRSDGERLLQLVQRQSTISNSDDVLLSVVSIASRAVQVQQRVAYLLHANTLLLAVEAFVDALPAPLRDVDALIQHLRDTAGAADVCDASPTSDSSASDLNEELRLDTATRSDWIACLDACAYSFASLQQRDVTDAAALHAAVAGAALVSATPQSQSPATTRLWQRAAHQLAAAGYYIASAFCLDELIRLQSSSAGAEAQATRSVDAVDDLTSAQCARAFVAFVQGDVVVTRLAVAKRCVAQRRMDAIVAATNLHVAYDTFTRLVALELDPSDVACLSQSQSNAVQRSTEDDDAVRNSTRDALCCRMDRPLATRFISRNVREVFTALNVMGVFFDEVGAFNTSLVFFAHASRICPDDMALQLRQVLAVPIVFDSQGAIDAFYQRLQRNIAALAATSVAVANDDVDAAAQRPQDATHLRYTITPSTMFIGYQGVDVLPIQRVIFDLRAAVFPRLSTLSSSSVSHEPQQQCPVPSSSMSSPFFPPRRIRVAFVSSWFRNHSVGKLLLGIVERLDRTTFEVVVVRCTHFLRDRDAFTTAFEAAADRFIELSADVDAAYGMLQRLAIDVVVFPELGMDEWLVWLSLRRLAPVQCVFWGHPITTGNPSIDYFLSSQYFVDNVREEEEKGGGHTLYHNARFSERVVLFRGLSTFFTRPDVTQRDTSVTRSQLHLPVNRRLYVCPQTLMKLHPAFDVVLDAILQRDARATIVLLASSTQRVWRAQLERRFRQSLGIRNAQRVQFMPTLAYASFMALLSFADVVLDPFPFGGGVTTLDALALGIPVVTLPTAQTVPQLAAGFLRRMNVTTTIVNSTDAFVAVAIAVANDVDGIRAQLQQTLLTRHSDVYDDAASIDDWNAFLTRVGRRADATRNA